LLALPPRRDEIDLRLGEAFAGAEAAFYAPPEREARSLRYDAAREALTEGLALLEAAAERAAAAAERGADGRDSAARRILEELEEADRLIAESEVREVAGFLFPPLPETEGAPSPAGELERHLELSAKMYRALAEAAHYQAERLRRTS
ncbi:MAG: hypothetical protein LBQ35_07705, partial [Spirochaetaceae bacterium]|nr:hypothetical protein [Spirochaetaceae bacterium]